MEERFSLAAERTGQIPSEGALGNAFDGFFSENAEYLAVMAEEYEWIRKGSLRTADLEELKRHNEICFIDLLGKNYDTSYANPAWAAKCLGGEFGPLLSAVCAELHSLPAFVYEQDLESVVIRMELFLEIYQAFVCAKQEKDSLPERKEIQEIFYWFASDYAETMAEKSVADAVDWERDFAKKIVEESANFGLLEEVWTTPKPGLVDRRDSGSHKDMDYVTFKRSIKAIVPYIVEMARTGLSFEGREEELFLVVREIGKSAEKAMLYATEGVNTHKGAIFYGTGDNCSDRTRRQNGPRH